MKKSQVWILILILGFSLFLVLKQVHANQLAGYTAVNISATDGVLPKIEKSGWTGIAFANITDTSINVTIKALRDSGTTVAKEVIFLAAHQKRVDVAQNLFTQDIDEATYIAYSATAPIVAFQLNGSSDHMMLDALPGLITTAATLYFPHVASDGHWETEICIINTDPVENLSGALIPYSSTGQPVSGSIPIEVRPKGRRQIVIGDEFLEPDTIGHLVFEGSTDKGVGYLKFYVVGQYRAAVPAAVGANTGDIYVSHIASTTDWWTGISMVNTTASQKQLIIEFDNGLTHPLSLEPFEHRVFSVREIFGGQPQPTIQAAVIRNGDGIVGLELFGSGNLLAGILLKDETSLNLYFPHIASDRTWWTGIVGYNPGDTTCTAQVTAYGPDGTLLDKFTEFIGPGEKYVGSALDLDLPPETGWLHLEADAPITGFELFGLLPQAVDDDGDGYTENQGDCNDADELIHPGAKEICGDGIDQDCTGADLKCEDVDDDGDGYTENQGDCNDADKSINPGAKEICGDGIDQDCNGSDLPCPPCINIAGNWYGSETVTFTCCVGRDCDTDTFSGTDTITIKQNKCNISYDIDVPGYGTCTRKGTIDKNKIHISGLVAILPSECTATENNIDINGTVDGDKINLQGSGTVKGTCDGYRFSCTGYSNATLTRLSSSATSKPMIGKESVRESSTPLLNNCIKIFTIIDH